MMVTWVTMHTSPEPVVEYGRKGFNHRVIAKTTRFVDGGSQKRHIYVHRALLDGLHTYEKYRKFKNTYSVLSTDVLVFRIPVRRSGGVK